MLRARAQIRLGRLEEALASLTSWEAAKNASHSFLGEYYTLLGTTLDRLGRHDRADDAFCDAMGHAFSVDHAELHAELNFYIAQAAWRRRDLKFAEHAATLALRDSRQFVRDERYARSIETSRAFCYELLGLIAATSGQFDSQIGHLLDALDAITTLAGRDVWTEASLLNNLASIVVDMHKPATEQVIRSRAESLPWNSEMGVWPYNVYRGLGWSAALRGDHLGAFRDLREADALAPSTPWRMEAILDRAYLFRELGESLSARHLLDEADRLSKQVNWRELTGEERSALLWLAELMAHHDPKRAEEVLSSYHSIKQRMDPALVASAGCNRFRGYELDSFGTVAAANGQPERAIALLAEARDIWIAFGFEWRAAKTARTIARITNATSDLADARRRAAAWPESWLSKTA